MKTKNLTVTFDLNLLKGDFKEYIFGYLQGDELDTANIPEAEILAKLDKTFQDKEFLESLADRIYDHVLEELMENIFQVEELDWVVQLEERLQEQNNKKEACLDIVRERARSKLTTEEYAALTGKR